MPLSNVIDISPPLALSILTELIPEDTLLFLENRLSEAIPFKNSGS